MKSKDLPPDRDQLVVVAIAPLETEAAVLAGVLKSHGLQAHTVGEFTAGFRAEAPGSVKVLVHQKDAAKAAQVLEFAQRDQAGFDWENVDVGEPENGEDD